MRVEFDDVEESAAHFAADSMDVYAQPKFPGNSPCLMRSIVEGCRYAEFAELLTDHVDSSGGRHDHV